MEGMQGKRRGLVLWRFLCISSNLDSWGLLAYCSCSEFLESSLSLMPLCYFHNCQGKQQIGFAFWKGGEKEQLVSANMQGGLRR